MGQGRWTRRGTLALLVCASMCAPIATVGNPVEAAADDVIFTVNSARDVSDAEVDGVCATVLAGECTFRAAIAEANAQTSAHVRIEFDIPGPGVHQIYIDWYLPHIDNGSAGITIDGFTQPGAVPNSDPLTDNAVRLIELVGSGPNGVEALIVDGANNVIRGLNIHRFRHAIRIGGAGAHGNVIAGNLIGLMPDGTLDPTYAEVVGAACITILGGASSNRIGLPGNEHRNVISGCYEKGVSLYSAFTWSNRIQNNIIGLDPTGTMRRANTFGVDVNWSTNGTLIGGLGEQEGNVISGNKTSAVELSHGTGTVNNAVVGNLIGTDPSGNSASPETVTNGAAIRIEGVPDCGSGVCAPDLSLATVTDNVIVNSLWGGILVDKGAHDSVIARNLIGVTRNGTVVGNSSYGILLSSAAHGITIGPDNVITGSEVGIRATPYSVDPVRTTPMATRRNTFVANEIHTTGGAGIDLFSSVPQGQAGADLFINDGLRPPGLLPIAGDIEAYGCTGCRVELFHADGLPGVPAQGGTSIAEAEIGATGAVRFSPPAGGWLGLVTATVTDVIGNTSEFAHNVDPAVDGVGPGVPVDAVGVAGDGSALVSFGAPTDGGPVQTYAVSASNVADPGGTPVVVLGRSSPVLVSGLVNGASYTFTVSASNGAGGSGESIASDIVVPTSVAADSTYPSQLGQGAFWRWLQVRGSGFGPGTSVSFGDGVEVKSLVVTSSTVLALKLSVDVDAEVGPRDVIVSSASGDVGSCVGCFSVTAGPVVTSYEPSEIVIGSSGTIDVVGVDLDPTVVVSISGNGVELGAVEPSGPGAFEISYTVAPDASPGARALSLRNPDGGLTTIMIDVVVAAGEVPGVPVSVVAVAGDGEATVSFGPPIDGAAVESYRVTAVDVADPGGVPVVVEGVLSSPMVVGGLTNGVGYTFTVSAVNGVGVGLESAPTAVVTPVGLPDDAVPAGFNSPVGGALAKAVRMGVVDS